MSTLTLAGLQLYFSDDRRSYISTVQRFEALALRKIAELTEFCRSQCKDCEDLLTKAAPLGERLLRAAADFGSELLSDEQGCDKTPDTFYQKYLLPLSVWASAISDLQELYQKFTKNPEAMCDYLSLRQAGKRTIKLSLFATFLAPESFQQDNPPIEELSPEMARAHVSEALYREVIESGYLSEALHRSITAIPTAMHLLLMTEDSAGHLNCFISRNDRAIADNLLIDLYKKRISGKPDEIAAMVHALLLNPLDEEIFELMLRSGYFTHEEIAHAAAISEVDLQKIILEMEGETRYAKHSFAHPWESIPQSHPNLRVAPQKNKACATAELRGDKNVKHSEAVGKESLKNAIAAENLGSSGDPNDLSNPSDSNAPKHPENPQTQLPEIAKTTEMLFNSRESAAEIIAAELKAAGIASRPTDHFYLSEEISPQMLLKLPRETAALLPDPGECLTARDIVAYFDSSLLNQHRYGVLLLTDAMMILDAPAQRIPYSTLHSVEIKGSFGRTLTLNFHDGSREAYRFLHHPKGAELLARAINQLLQHPAL